MSSIDSGEVFLVEESQRIDFRIINRKAKIQLKEALLQTEISSLGFDIKLSSSKTGFGGLRYWLTCPLCSDRKQILHVHPYTQILGCRSCLGLEYRSRRYKGMLENI